MPSNRGESSEESTSLTPEVAERVVERFLQREAERQHVEAAERERAAEVARIQELADLLGTTPEDVAQIAREVGGQSSHVPSAAETRPVTEKRVRGARWTLHAIYLPLLAMVLVWGAVQKAALPSYAIEPGRYPLIRLSSGQPPVSALSFDPYLGGYVRQMSIVGAVPIERMVVDPSLKAPPSRLKVTLITPELNSSIVGSQGTVPDTPQAARALREAIVSLLTYEEASAPARGVLPTVDYDRLPYQANRSFPIDQPRFVGWHLVEVSDGRRTFRDYLPDRRYAKDPVRFEQALKARLERFVDTKFFPSQLPANLRADAETLAAPLDLPKGVDLMVWNDTRTVLFKGTVSGEKASPEAIGVAIEKAASRLKNTGDLRGYLHITAVFPGGEAHRYWPTDAVPDQDGTWRVSQRKETVGSLSNAIRLAFENVDGVPPKLSGPYRWVW